MLIGSTEKHTLVTGKVIIHYVEIYSTVIHYEELYSVLNLIARSMNLVQIFSRFI